MENVMNTSETTYPVNGGADEKLDYLTSKIAPVYEVRSAETADGCKVFAGISVVLADQVASGKDQ